MRYTRLRRELQLMKDAYPDLGLCVYEEPHRRGGAATEYALGCVGMLQSWCADRGVEHSSVHTARLKRFATGSGRADKQSMIFAAARAIGIEDGDGGLNDDEADAILVYRYAIEELVG